MPDPRLFKLFLKPLHSSGISYCVTGSVAGIIYGEPRLTHDIDVIIEIQTNDIALLTRFFPEDQFYMPPEDIIIIEHKREDRGHLNIIHKLSGFKADIYFTGKDPLSRWAVQHAITIDYEQIPISVARPEYVIVRKLEYYREGNIQKHLADIEGILKHSSELIDFNQLSRFIEQCSLQKEWKLVHG